MNAGYVEEWRPIIYAYYNIMPLQRAIKGGLMSSLEILHNKCLKFHKYIYQASKVDFLSPR